MMPPYVQKSAYKLSLFFVQKEAFGPLCKIHVTQHNCSYLAEYRYHHHLVKTVFGSYDDTAEKLISFKQHSLTRESLFQLHNFLVVYLIINVTSGETTPMV